MTSKSKTMSFSSLSMFQPHLTACDCCPVEQCCRCEALTPGWACYHCPLLLLLALVWNATVPEHGCPSHGCSPATRRVGTTWEWNGRSILARRVTAWGHLCQVPSPFILIRPFPRPRSPSAVHKPGWCAQAAHSVQPWTNQTLPAPLSLHCGRNEVRARGVHFLEQQVMLQAPDGCTGV